jgi:hypothetical protein
LKRHYEEAQEDLTKWYLETKRIALTLTSNPVYHGEDSADDLFWQTWSAHLSDKPEGYPSTMVAPRSRVAQQLYEFLMIEVENIPPELRDDEAERFIEACGVTGLEFFEICFFLQQELLKKFIGNRLCSVTAGYLAIVPRCVEPGDVVAHVRGGYMPVVLRKTSNDELRAEIVGVCSVHGVDDVYQANDWERWLLE